jgi:hypothetical protein
VDEMAANTLRSLCQAALAEEVTPYDAAMQMWEIGLKNAAGSGGTRANDVAWAHWLIWGFFTDWIERNPAEQPLAESAILDAAKGWLVVEFEPEARAAFFDHLIYEVCGYERPSRSQ